MGTSSYAHGTNTIQSAEHLAPATCSSQTITSTVLGTLLLAPQPPLASMVTHSTLHSPTQQPTLRSMRCGLPLLVNGLRATQSSLLQCLSHSTSATLPEPSTLSELMATTRASAWRSTSAVERVNLTSGKRMAGSTRATRCGLMASAIVPHSLLCPASPRTSEVGLQPRTLTKCPAAETSISPSTTQLPKSKPSFSSPASHLCSCTRS